MKTLKIPKYNENDNYNMAELPADFNWIAVLKDLNAGAKLHYISHQRLKNMAATWPTCACGQLCKYILRDDLTREPKDVPLQWLGMAFMEAIDEQEWSTALGIFHKIEARTTVLLNESNFPLEHK